MNNLANMLNNEGLKIASLKKRIIAFILDNIIISTLILIYILLNQDLKDNIEENMIIIQQYIFQLMLLQLIYHAFFTYYYGASIGKIICKIAIISESTLNKPNIIQSINRSIFRIISDNIFMLGFVWSFLNIDRKTWHDYVAKTVVIELA